MKKKILSIIIFIIITIALLYITKVEIDKSILKSTKEQVRVLRSIYGDLASRYPYYISFDNSALRNFITNESFSEENMAYIKDINEEREETDTKVVLSMSYNKNTKTITLKLKTISNGNISQIQVQSYKLVVKNGKIKVISQKRKYVII